MAKPSDPTPKPKGMRGKHVVGSGKGITKLDAKAFGPRKPKTGKTTTGKKK